jgi:hypothetical protein
LAVAALLVGSCTHFGAGSGRTVKGDGACAVVDSVLAASGLRAEIEMRGRATIDVNQYRVRGRFELAITPDGDLTFDITSTTLLGGHREDAVLSFYADTLRVLDRERGRFYEGEAVDGLVMDGTGVALDLGQLLRHATARTPACRRIGEVRRRDRGEEGFELTGLFDEREFELRLERSRLAFSAWPLPGVEDWRNDRVETTYTWVGDRLARVVIAVPDRRWRVKLVSE